MIRPDDEKYNYQSFKGESWQSYEELRDGTKAYQEDYIFYSDRDAPPFKSPRMERSRTSRGLDILIERPTDILYFSYEKGSAHEPTKNSLIMEIREKVEPKYQVKQELRPLHDPCTNNRQFQTVYSLKTPYDRWRQLLDIHYIEGTLMSVFWSPIDIDVTADNSKEMISFSPKTSNDLRFWTDIRHAISTGAQHLNIFCYGLDRVVDLHVPVQVDSIELGRIDNFFNIEQISEANGPLVVPEDLGFNMELGTY